MRNRPSTLFLFLLGVAFSHAALSESPHPVYFAHAPVEDANGVIAPWYKGQNGPFDARVRIAAETLKRYPWTKPGEAPVVAPHYVYNGEWRITEAGEISIPQTTDWNNGDQSQRIAFVLTSLVDYYRYTGDAAAIAHITVAADALLKLSLTPSDHPWPSFPVSVPLKGKPYGVCDPKGHIQTDVAAEVGYALLKAYQITGREDWFKAVQHWGDILADRLGTGPDGSPWSRYANPEDVSWPDLMTGGVTYILFMLDELIRLGYCGESGQIVAARDAGVTYLRDVLLPKWTAVDTWGRNFWDWECAVQCEYVTTFPCRYLMAHRDEFPNWRNDVRNIASLFINHTVVANASNGDVYSGAWAYPESAGCCGRSLWYPTQEVSSVFAEYGVRAGSEWGRELARRQQLLCTYDFTETGFVEDNVDGGQIVAGAWFKITHPMSLKHILVSMGWLPEVEGPNRENHIMRSSSVVKHVVYRKGAIQYTTFDAPAPAEDTLRLAFKPSRITADGAVLRKRADLEANGYTVKPLQGGDWLVVIRHDGATEMLVCGDDPQKVARAKRFDLDGTWNTADGRAAASAPNASMAFPFTGNQVRLTGSVGLEGGLADVYLDGRKQLVGMDCWNPETRDSQILYYRNGLDNAPHELKIVVRGEGNPVSKGRQIWLETVQWSDAEGDSGYGSGGGPADVQRWVFGYPGRTPLEDKQGNPWLTATEFIARAGDMEDSVARTWWTEPRAQTIEGVADADQALYKYGAHWQQLKIHVTVAPGTYHARLKFSETRDAEPLQRAFDILVNGETKVKGFDITATAGGRNRAVDLVFNGIQPRNGCVTIELRAGPGGEAIIQALEVGPGEGGQGSKPVCVGGSVAANGT